MKRNVPEITLVAVTPDDVDLVVDPVTTEAAAELDGPAKVAGFEGKPGQVLVLERRLLVGLGPTAKVDANGVRRAAAVAARTAARCERIAARFPLDHPEAVADGFALGAYAFNHYRSDAPPQRLAEVHLVGKGGAPVRKAIDRARRVAEAVAVARDLVNEPGGLLTAAAFADRATKLAEANGLVAEVLDEKAIRKAGHAGVLAVNRGSTQPPRFVELTYEPEGGRPRGTVALVGKGITFDSGGLSLKTAEGMTWMKDDMGGAAAVLAAMSALRDLGVKAKVHGFLPLTDNMPGGDAQRVGDVIRYRNGRTVEVLNTDAEGRLILADALIRASETDPDAIVDLATLTGAAEVALGKRVAALFGTHDGLVEAVQAAADRAGEPVWPMPMVDGYRKDLDSKIADLKNVTSGRTGGAITAALFLREFVGEGIPWVHLDIAGPAFADDADGENPAGGTGFGVRTILELLRDFRRPTR